MFKHDQVFNNIRDMIDLQQIVHDVAAKYQAEHEWGQAMAGGA